LLTKDHNFRQEKKFDIDKASGVIVVKDKLDYEKIPVYNLVVQARDKGFFSKSATSGVKIILQDVDDNPPTFDKVTVPLLQKGMLT
jgi:hypothetical protein